MHASDIRTIHNSSSRLVDILNCLAISTSLLTLDDTKYFTKLLEAMIELINKDFNPGILTSPSGQISFDFLYNIYDVDKILSNQLNNLDIYIKESILKFYKSIYEAIYTKDYILNILQSILKDINNNGTIPNTLRSFIIKWIFSMMDIYILSNIFNNDNTNIIVLTGEKHIININNFLLSIGSNLIYEQKYIHHDIIQIIDGYYPLLFNNLDHVMDILLNSKDKEDFINIMKLLNEILPAMKTKEEYINIKTPLFD